MLVSFAGTGITKTSCLDRSGARSRQHHRHRMTSINLFFYVSTNSGSRSRTASTIGVTCRIFQIRMTPKPSVLKATIYL